MPPLPPSTPRASKNALRRRVSANLRTQRDLRGWTQQYVAARVGMTPQHYQRIESGSTNMPLITLARIARVFELDVAAFVQLNPLDPEIASLDGFEQIMINALRRLTGMQRRRVYNFTVRIERLARRK